MHTVYVSFGSNLGHRLGYLQRAFEALNGCALTQIEASVILETPALLLPNAPREWDKPYLNMVVRAKTSLQPESLLSALKLVEGECGRDLNAPRWSPREIDLDL
ncbi:MAG: 2-amino-4-hydroxy-6-hydroxymethyldihydropteridine diphosphokinase [Opitutales bacterium]|nr:2-amino-4-hydroxy-6-hydroxymethyldihydropteridine diphosphokinase [Opitutales bacterium]